MWCLVAFVGVKDMIDTGLLGLPEFVLYTFEAAGVNVC